MGRAASVSVYLSYFVASFVAGTALCPLAEGHTHGTRCSVVYQSLLRIQEVCEKYAYSSMLESTQAQLEQLGGIDTPGSAYAAVKLPIVPDDAADPADVERSMYTTLANLHDCAIVAAAAHDDVAATARDAAARDAVALATRACTTLRWLQPHVPNATLVEMTTLLGELVRPVLPATFPYYCCNLSHKAGHFRWANTDANVPAVWHKVRLVHAVHTEEALASVLSLVANEDGKVVLRATLKSREPPRNPFAADFCHARFVWFGCQPRPLKGKKMPASHSLTSSRYGNWVFTVPWPSPDIQEHFGHGLHHHERVPSRKYKQERSHVVVMRKEEGGPRFVHGDDVPPPPVGNVMRLTKKGEAGTPCDHSDGGKCDCSLECNFAHEEGTFSHPEVAFACDKLVLSHFTLATCHHGIGGLCVHKKRGRDCPGITSKRATEICAEVILEKLHDESKQVKDLDASTLSPAILEQVCAGVVGLFMRTCRSLRIVLFAISAGGYGNCR